jgi:predicted ATPase
MWAWSAGLPAAITEFINYLWDEQALVPRDETHWALARNLDDLEDLKEDFDSVIQLRVRRLPTSARRLVSIAAIAGHRFDADLIQKASSEHIEVVDICIRLMLERWLIRQYPLSWSQSGRESDLVLWARGARRGTFEFAHKGLRKAILDDINPLRRQAMHSDVASALRQQWEHDLEAVAEQLAYHEVEATNWELALPQLEIAAAKARAAGADEIADWYYHKCHQVLDRLIKGARSDSAKKQWSKRKKKTPATTAEESAKRSG